MPGAGLSAQHSNQDPARIPSLGNIFILNTSLTIRFSALYLQGLTISTGAPVIEVNPNQAKNEYRKPERLKPARIKCCRSADGSWLAWRVGEQAVVDGVGQQAQDLGDEAHLPGNDGVAGTALNGAHKAPRRFVGR